jgi:hypothetical protein
MQITVRTAAEAERIVADVWVELERARLPSPRVTVRPQAPGLIIEFQFEQQSHAELIRSELLQVTGLLLVKRNRSARGTGDGH